MLDQPVHRLAGVGRVRDDGVGPAVIVERKCILAGSADRISVWLPENPTALMSPSNSSSLDASSPICSCAALAASSTSRRHCPPATVAIALSPRQLSAARFVAVFQIRG
jgi:hypothetical protein